MATVSISSRTARSTPACSRRIRSTSASRAPSCWRRSRCPGSPDPVDTGAAAAAGAVGSTARSSLVIREPEAPWSRNGGALEPRMLLPGCWLRGWAEQSFLTSSQVASTLRRYSALRLCSCVWSSSLTGDRTAASAADPLLWIWGGWVGDPALADGISVGRTHLIWWTGVVAVGSAPSAGLGPVGGEQGLKGPAPGRGDTKGALVGVRAPKPGSSTLAPLLRSCRAAPKARRRGVDACCAFPGGLQRARTIRIPGGNVQSAALTPAPMRQSIRPIQAPEGKVEE